MDLRWHHITIEEITDERTGKRHYSADFINALRATPHEERRLRIDLEKVRSKPENYLITCHLCCNPVMLRGIGFEPGSRKRKRLHFTHARPNANCPYQNPNVKSKQEINRIKYHGQREGPEHILLKERFAECIRLQGKKNGSITQVRVEKTVRSDESTWKKPDVNFFYRETHVAMEIQLSTTYLDVINERHRFYREQGIYMLWLFNSLNLHDEEREFAKSDVIFNNNENAYVFSADEYANSIDKEKLYLTCYYLSYSFDKGKGKITSKWNRASITLDELTFDEERGCLYYFDSTKTRKEAEADRKQYQENRERNRERKVQLSAKIETFEASIIELRQKHTSCLDEIVSNRTEALGLLRRYRELVNMKQDIGSRLAEVFRANNSAELIRLAEMREYSNDSEAVQKATKLESSIRQCDEFVSVLVNMKKHFSKVIAAMKGENLELVDITNQFRKEFYFKHIDKLWGKHRCCPTATRYHKRLDILEYDVNNPDGNSAIFIEREDILAVLDDLIKKQVAEGQNLEGERRHSIHELLNMINMQHAVEIEKIRGQITQLGDQRRNLRRSKKETEILIDLTNSGLSEARKEHLQLEE